MDLRVAGDAARGQRLLHSALHFTDRQSRLVVRALHGRCGDSIDGLGFLVGPRIPTSWSPETHADYPRRTRRAIVTAMLCSKRPGNLLARLNNELLHLVLAWVAAWTVYPAGYDVVAGEKKYPKTRTVPPGNSPGDDLTKYTEATASTVSGLPYSFVQERNERGYMVTRSDNKERTWVNVRQWRIRTRG